MGDARLAAAADAAGDCSGGPVQIGLRWTVLRGHAHGLRGPVLLGAMRWPVQLEWDAEALAAMLGEAGGLEPADIQRCLAGGPHLSTFFALMLALETAAQTPVAQAGVSVGPATHAREWTAHAVAVPGFMPQFTQALLEWLTSAINLCQATTTHEQRRVGCESINARLNEARAALRKELAPGGVNTARIARAGGELGLPVQWLPSGHLQVGSGPNARLFKSTLTDATPVLSTMLARSKSTTAAMLALRGLPVPKHQLVASEAQAVQAAQGFGYPVVVKPDDRDGGLGVHAGLQNDEQVRQCFRHAMTVSPNVLVETHVEGNDYRITVDTGRVVKAIGRQPGGVLGDGRQTVEALVKAVGASQPAARALGSSSVVSVDDEAIGLLAERGMTAHSVPPDGEFVALRRRANMSTGGTSRDVLAALHPDNARLAIRAAQALRLDLAGVDLIIPDIAVSWMDCQAAICEVNAQPQISTQFAPTVYRDLLARMVPAPSRLRAVLVLNLSSEAEGNASVATAAAHMTQQGERVLSVRTDGVWLGEERIAPAGRRVFPAAVAAELELDATAAVVALTPGQVLRNGLPWPHLDQVRVVGGMAGLDAQGLRACLELLAPHLAGELAVDASTAALLDPAVLQRFTVTTE